MGEALKFFVCARSRLFVFSGAQDAVKPLVVDLWLMCVSRTCAVLMVTHVASHLCFETAFRTRTARLSPCRTMTVHVVSQ